MRFSRPRLTGRVDFTATGYNILACCLFPGRAYADLDRRFGNDQTSLYCLISPGAMTGRLAEVVLPSIAMSIEMDQRQRPTVQLAIGTRQRQGDRMIAAELPHVMFAREIAGHARQKSGRGRSTTWQD